MGERVRLLNAKHKLFPGKLKSRWTGPFEVTRVYNNGHIIVNEGNGGFFKVNGQLAKHYYNDIEEPLPYLKGS